MANRREALIFSIKLGFGNVGFCREKKTGVPREKPLRARMTNSQQKIKLILYHDLLLFNDQLKQIKKTEYLIV